MLLACLLVCLCPAETFHSSYYNGMRGRGAIQTRKGFNLDIPEYLFELFRRIKVFSFSVFGFISHPFTPSAQLASDMCLSVNKGFRIYLCSLNSNWFLRLQLKIELPSI